MGRSVNKVTLIGTLGRDPEVRYLPNGNAVANLTMATDESYNDKQTGQKVEQTEWHRITAYGKLPEIIQQYRKKGSKAYLKANCVPANGKKMASNATPLKSSPTT